MVSCAAVFGLIVVVVFAAAYYVEIRNDLSRTDLRAAEYLRHEGRLDEARHLLQRAALWNIDPAWRGEALQLVGTPELLPRRQLLVRQGDESLALQASQVSLGWLDPERLRVRTLDRMSVWSVSTGERLAEGPALPVSAAPLNGLPPGAAILSRVSDNAWAVVRLTRPTMPHEQVVLWDVHGRRVSSTLPDVGPLPAFVVLSADGRHMAYLDPQAPETVRSLGLEP